MHLRKVVFASSNVVCFSLVPTGSCAVIIPKKYYASWANLSEVHQNCFFV